MNIQFGLETEAGITRENPENIDVVAESINLVRSAITPGVRMCWDYSLEDPHVDARGFRAKELLQDSDEANYFAQDAQRTLSFTEIKSDLVLKNGARFYNDHAHPEYCTPECSTLLELLQQDWAGDSILMACVKAVNELNPKNPVRLYKNNTDFQGHSYGCHENYLISRGIPWEYLNEAMQAFLVTRQIFTGAGKYAWEEEDRYLGAGFQISQRSDFFSELQSIDTMQRRPIINTRDEPHANPKKYRRFHVIVGDSNLAPYANYLKVGTTALVLDLLTRGLSLDLFPKLADPLKAMKDISRDPKWKWECDLKSGASTAVAVQREYLKLVRAHGDVWLPQWKPVLDVWEKTLNDLERDPLSTSDRLDWSAKYKLIEQFRTSEKVATDDPHLMSLDLAYHELDKERGLFYGLLDGGAMTSPFPMERIKSTGINAPLTTRAAVRGLCIEKFGPLVESAQWDYILIRGEKRRIKLSLLDLFSSDAVAQTVAFIQGVETVDQLSKLPFAKSLS
ncbi:MAG: proteasome accessory factor PafA2 family protein [Verrucomicrobiota bacterium]|nr:proteasome accessory factor PafA2 family protein [Verrucomicrobiota bacterium]